MSLGSHLGAPGWMDGVEPQLLGEDLVTQTVWEFLGTLCDTRNWPVFRNLGVSSVASHCAEARTYEDRMQLVEAVGDLRSGDEIELLQTKLANLDLSHMLPADQIVMVNDLVEFTAHFATLTTDIGLLSDFQFDIEVINDRPTQATPIRYPPEQRKWLTDYLNQMQQLDVIARVQEGDWACNVVLVPEGQSNQAFRMCVNYRPLNPKIRFFSFPIPDMQGILDVLGQYQHFSVIDIKAGFHNIRVGKESQKYLCFVTQDGYFTFLRMPFGIATAPAFFQYVMSTILEEHILKICVVYIDDITVFGNTYRECWDNTITVLRTLTRAGFNVSVKKLQLCQDRIKILGHNLGSQGLSPHLKKLTSVDDVKVPTNFKQLQQIHGLLNYFRPYVPQYQQIMGPIIKLLGQKQVQWDASHTGIVRTTIKFLLEAARVVSPRFDELFQLHVDFDTESIFAALVQSQGVVQYGSSRFSTAMMQGTTLARSITALHWSVNHFKPYLTFVKFAVHIADLTAQTLVRTKGMHLHIQALLLDLSMYDFTVAPSVRRQLFAPPVPAEEVAHPVSEFATEHSDGGAVGRQLKGKCVSAYFDGGKCCIGVALYDAEGRLVAVEGSSSEEQTTNNEAEFAAALRALEMVVERSWDQEFDFVRIVGDSRLVIRFLGRVYTPRKGLFQLSCERAFGIMKRFAKGFQFCHVRRQYNELADYMGRLAVSQNRTVDLSDLGQSLLEKYSRLSEAVQVEGNLQAYLRAPRQQTEEEFQQEPCGVCDQGTSDDDHLLCDLCNSCYHLACVHLDCAPRGFWYCEQCTEQIESGQVRDVTVDFSLIEFLFKGIKPGSPAELDRVQRAAQFLATQDGQLVCLGKSGWRVIPAIADRWSVLDEYHSLGHLATDRLYVTVAKRYYWAGMRSDCAAFCAQCLGCQREMAKYSRHKELTPIDKGTKPLQVWSVDLFLGMPMGSRNQTVGITCVDPFSKLVLLGALQDKSSREVAFWFYSNVMCAFGTPCEVRTDNGLEFQGDFARLMRSSRVKQRFTSAYYPQSNGQAEVVNKLVKTALRKLLGVQPQAFWDDLLPGVQFGLRVAVASSHGYSPFEIVFGQQPQLPGLVGQWELQSPPEEYEQGFVIDQIVASATHLYRDVRERLVKADGKMRDSYSKDPQAPEALFEPGDLVWVKHRQAVRKMDLKSQGPCEFISYGRSMRTARVKMPSGTVVKVSTTHLCPGWF